MCDKRILGLQSTVESTLELSVLLRCMYAFVYYHTEDFGLSPSLLILIHNIYQAQIRSITFTLTKHIDQKLAEAL